jgi:hypothetical protein
MWRHRPSPPSSPTYADPDSLRDALDNQSITDPDVCCLVERTTSSGELKKVQFSGDTFTFAGVAAGAVQISVKPYLGYVEQARQLTIAGNTVADFQLQPLPVLLRGEVLDARREARAPRCTAKIEILTGPDAGRVTSTTVAPGYQFAERLQPATVTIRFSATGGYETKERLARLRASPKTTRWRRMRRPPVLAAPSILR